MMRDRDGRVSGRSSVAGTLAIIVTSVAIAAVAGLQTASLVLARNAPQLADRVFPMGGSANDKLASIAARAATSAQLSGATVDAVQVASLTGQARKFANKAVRYDPLAVDSQTVLALAQDDVDDRRRSLSAINQLSRRSGLLNGALLDRYRRDGDFAGTLRVLDETLRIRPGLGKQVIPLMVDLLKQPGGVAAFEKILSQHPAWINRFLQRAASDGNLGAQTVELRVSFGSDLAISRETDRAIMSSLIKNREFAEAAELYKLVRPLGDAQASGSPDRLSWRDDLPPLDWRFADDRGFYARPGLNGKELEISVRPGFGGQLAERFLSLGKGSRGLEIRHDITPEEQLSALSLEVTCLEDSSALANTKFYTSPMRVEFSQPENSCTLVRIKLNGRVWSGDRRISGRIAPLDILRH